MSVPAPPRRVLVTGAGGKTGRAVVAAIAHAGGQPRAFVRSRRPIPAAEVAVGDQRVVADLVAALDGIDAVYAIAPNLDPDEVDMADALIAACRHAGVERVVFHSVVHPQLASMPHHADKARAEARLLESGLVVTILQPNVYMQNLAAFADELRAGRLAVPYATHRRFGMVDLRDVADVAARAVLDDAGAFATWELSGPENVTMRDVARAASGILRREVAATRRPPAAGTSDQDPERARRLLAMFTHYDRHGSPGEATVLAATLGRAPRRVVDVLRELLDGSDTPPARATEEA